MIIALIIVGGLIGLAVVAAYVVDPARHKRVQLQNDKERERMRADREREALAVIPSDSEVKEAENKVKIAQATTMVKREEMVQAHLDKAKESLELTPEMEKLSLLPPTPPAKTQEVAKFSQPFGEKICPGCGTKNLVTSKTCALCGRNV